MTMCQRTQRIHAATLVMGVYLPLLAGQGCNPLVGLPMGREGQLPDDHRIDADHDTQGGDRAQQGDLRIGDPLQGDLRIGDPLQGDPFAGDPYTPECGNSIMDPGEACDDGNLA